MTNPCRVAIADDEPVVAKFLQDCLRRAGYEIVVVADTGEELVRLCSATKPDLIITDIEMGSMDGLAAVETILKSHQLPVIILTAYHRNDYVDRANDCHVLAYLVKPVRELDLLAAIPVALQRFHELQSLRTEASSMRQALEDRKVIERAKGIIMDKLNLDEATAFRHLQKLARSHRKQLVELAHSIVLAETALSSTTTEIHN